MIHDDKGKRSYDQYRTSSSASIRRHQTSMVKCIEKRFAQFQGDINVERLEPFQIVKYTPDQQVCDILIVIQIWQIEFSFEISREIT